ncbi:glycosyl transferase [Flavobacterium sp. CYK-4]|uniref:glycosyltransferase family protein n=1 Tax=Flavobacterium lotistagni TaxID=2709660 RepID=UPI00140DA7AC|nr:glycosyltransferase family protein [Flavobacterium lotistagni]NHM08037.1 glycosyl transferase [Flavobacterium lotistagni]
MKILYAIQGTGNGHLSRALDIIPCLQRHGEVDILVSGIQGDLKLPYAVKYQLKGLSFIFGKKGGVDLLKTITRSHPRKLYQSIQQLPVETYDLVINDFEPVSAWACFVKNKPCIALSHQAAVLSKDFPQPEETDKLGQLILQNYAPADYKYGFHFRGNDNDIFTPVVRKQVRELNVTDQGHYTVYLPSYSDELLIERLSAFEQVQWQVFSKHNHKKIVHQNIIIEPINGERFINSMAASTGVLCGAGFETPAEALFLGKKLLVIPMKNQYEQQLNAEALRQMNVPVIKSLKPKWNAVIADWLDNGKRIAVNYPDKTQEIIDGIVAKHA